MEPLAKYDRNTILGEDVFIEIFDQEDEIMKARLILSLTDRAAELGVKGKFEELLRAYKKVDRENKRREREKPVAMLERWTNFDGPYENMFCGAWLAGEDGVYAQNDSQIDAVACYHPILPIERMKNLETGEEQIKIAYKRNGIWNEIIVATHLKKRFGVSQYNAERLMITELARVQTEAQKLSFERNDYEEY